MKYNFYYLFFSLLLLFSLSSVQAQWIHREIDYDGYERDYWMYVPTNYNESKPAKLVVTLHGMGDNDTNFRNIGFNAIADTANIIILVPNALPFNSDNPLVQGIIGGSRTWNSGAGISVPILGDVFPNEEINDVGFINAIVDQTGEEYVIDEARRYICGFSKGGFMTQRMAIESNYRYAAFGTVAGTYGTGLVNPNPGRPIPLVHINGTADDRVNWQENNPPLPFQHFVGDMIDFWVANNNCDETPIVTALPDIASDGFTVEHHLYDNGDKGTVVEVFIVDGAEHVWLGAGHDIHYTNELWKFFNRYTLDNVSVSKLVKNEFVVYPNPTATSLIIATEVSTPLVVSIRDIHGKRVIQEEIVLQKQIDVSLLSAGIYTVQIEDEVKKVVIER